MKKILVIFSISSFTGAACLAQKSAASVYAEFGGPGLASLNFDTRFNKTENGIGARIGIGGFSVNATPATFIPAEINWLAGHDGKNYLEAGGGITFVSLSNKITTGSGAANNEKFKNTFAHVTLGYRFQPAKGGFLFKAALTPLFNSHFFIPYYLGVAVGYKF